MTTRQTVSFAGAGGLLKLDNLAAFQAKIFGFGAASEIDLGGFVSSIVETVSWKQAGTSGTLVVHDGAKVASLVLIGGYTTADFHLSRDNAGGTFIRAIEARTDTRPAGATAAPDLATTRFAQAAAGFESGRAGASLAMPGAPAPLGATPLAEATTSGR